jgi:DNA-binding NtrC family response regulator
MDRDKRDARPGQMVTVGSDSTGRPHKLLLRVAGLRVLNGGQKGTTFRISESTTVVGNQADCDIVLEDRRVSARHAEISLREEGYLLTDLGSRNGTLAGDWRVKQIFLRPGMVLTLGHTTLEVEDLAEQVEVTLSKTERLHNAVGRSAGMRRVFALLEAAARSEATVLLQGETGTGKEVLAEALHGISARAGGPFVVFDCSTVPEHLLESEIFGHERGAFTDATATRPGVLERAHGGTLFLDEIGELALELQPKLLRAIETRRFRRVGANTNRAVDVRFVAATCRNLQQEMAQGRFRQDLYYRLAVMRVHVPPLRERREDLPLLVRHFAERLAAPRLDERLAGLMPLLQSYAWPGNVRELRNVVERLAVLPPEDALPSAILERGRRSRPLPYADAKARAVDEFERRYLQEILSHAGGSVTRAADLAGVSRRWVTQLVAKHKLRSDLQD